MNADQEYGEILFRLLEPDDAEPSLPDALVLRLANEHSVEDVVHTHAAVLERRLQGADGDARRLLLLRASRLLAQVLMRFGWAASAPLDEGVEAPAPPLDLEPAALARELQRTSRLLVETRARLRRATATDPLTGILNARQFYTALQCHLDQARKLARPLSLVLADLDDFGDYNLRFGREAGDAVLVEVARLLLRSCRAGDLVTRIAGDEFALVCPATDLRGGLVLAERIRDTIARHDFVPHRLTASFGAVAFPADADTEEALVDRARQAARLAARLGGNAVHAYLMPACDTAQPD